MVAVIWATKRRHAFACASRSVPLASADIPLRRSTWRMLFTTIHYYLPICLPTFTSLFTLAYQPVHPCPL